MKTAIHPTYYKEAKITCACGNSFTVGSTREDIRVEICSNCHPFYTGQQKLIDTARRVDKFQKRIEAKTSVALERKGRRVKRAKRDEKRQLKIDESKRPSSKHRQSNSSEA